MKSIIKFEMKKMTFRVGVIITWILVLMLSTILIRQGSISDIYADMFSKAYGMAPFTGLLLFSIVSGSYTKEYDNNMVGLINSTKYGKKNLAIGKAIAAGISTSIVSLSIIAVIFTSAIMKTGGKKLDMPLKSLWYFGNSGSDMKVYQLIILMVITVILASFIFSQIGLYLSSISKSAIVPFIFGGIIMGAPYFIASFSKTLGKITSYTPIGSMYFCQVIRYKVSIAGTLIALVILFILSMKILPKLSSRAFSK